MADTKVSSTAPKSTPDGLEPITASTNDGTVADPKGIVSNREDAGGTRQREPKPEDYPAAAKVTPPAEQFNSALSQVVGTASVPKQIEAPGSAGLENAGQHAQDSIAEAIEATDKAFEQKAKADPSNNG